MLSNRCWWLPGALAISFILTLTVLPLLSLLVVAGELSFSTLLSKDYIQRVIFFSLYQATLSTALSVLLAIPIACALSSEPRFPGRTLLINLFSLSLVIPTIVAIFGIVAVYGRTGWANDALSLLGIERMSIYGLGGILLAHVFFNMPLATRVLLQSLDGIASEQWRLATQLGMNRTAQFRFIEWPSMRGQLAGLSILIFTLCFTSFAIVMTLGGGPKATTIEVAIYQALRFDFDISTAVTLALVQLALCTALMLLSAAFGHSPSVAFNYHQTPTLFRPKTRHRTANAMLIALSTGFVILPLIGLAVAAINPAVGDVLFHAGTHAATINTVIVALTAAIVSLCLGMGLLVSTRHIRVRLSYQRVGQWVQLIGNVILVLPPLVLGTGLYLLLRPFADVFALALILVVAINSLMALPFVLRILDGPMMRAAHQHDQLVRSLGITGWNRWRLIDWPVLRKPIGLCLAVAATLSAGDLSAIALFGSERVTTLPLLLYQRIGGYRLYDAAVTAGLLLVLCLVMFMLLQRFVGGRNRAAA